MDKTWIKLRNRRDPRYEKGADDFVSFASAHRPDAVQLLCPCRKCKNMKFVKKDEVSEHIVVDGFLDSYTCWIFHGESSPSLVSVPASNNLDNMQEMIHDAFGIPPPNYFGDTSRGDPDQQTKGPNDETKSFFNLVCEAERELYPGCKKYSTLSFLVRLLHIKCLGGWSDKSFTMLLELLKDALPEGETLPKSFYGARKIIGNLGLEMHKVHACPNDCMLYWKETENETECKRCHMPRYKEVNSQSEMNNKKDKKVPLKVVRYFPLIPRVQRLFMSSKTASYMRWHADKRTDDGILRHPADSPAWKKLDEIYPDFASDPRNVRLGLSSDGFNPFKTMSNTHSTWPVVLVTYNLPPWLCTKQPYMIMSLLIDGPNGPGNNIDVYLRLLVDELKELWTGVLTYDASSNQMFVLRASLLWTISDFPAYANLSGWSTKGKLACPCCHKFTRFRWLNKGRKHCYLGHRRWLPEGHNFRRDQNSFDGTIELDPKPPRLTGVEAYEEVRDINVKFGKDTSKRRKRGRDDIDDDDDGGAVELPLPYNWKKKSIFFELDYWKHNLLPHNLDIMHIEKNVTDNLLFTLLNVDGRGKDNLNARLDLQEMGIRRSLHPQERGSNKLYIPPACFTLDNKDKEGVLKLLKEVKFPDGYASNISRCVHIQKRTISGLKSHDNHVLMQELLPIALRGVLPDNVLKPIIELSNFFKQICSKVMKGSDLDHTQSRIELTLCHLERIFPPSFFDVMEHLVIHLAEEAKIAGPPQTRWMFFIERYLSTLKNYVKTRSHPEGSIAQGYWVEECLTFCSRYLNDVETKSNRPTRNYDGGEDLNPKKGGRILGKSEGFVLDNISYAQAHRYILVNNDDVVPYIDLHRTSIKRANHRLRVHEINRLHNETFHTWFQEHVGKLLEAGTSNISDEIRVLAMGPQKKAKRFSGYILNGVRYHTKNREARRTTQNSGIMVKAMTESYASSRDQNPVHGNVNYYGVITDIVEICYSKEHKFVLFKCDWADNNRGVIEQDDLGFTLVNFKYLLYTKQQLSDEPFILATQARQVFYVQDPMKDDWNVVVKTKPRDFFDLFEESPVQSNDQDDLELWGQQDLDGTSFEPDSYSTWVRQGVDGIEVENLTRERVNDD